MTRESNGADCKSVEATYAGCERLTTHQEMRYGQLCQFIGLKQVICNHQSGVRVLGGAPKHNEADMKISKQGWMNVVFIAITVFFFTLPLYVD